MVLFSVATLKLPYWESLHRLVIFYFCQTKVIFNTLILMDPNGGKIYISTYINPI